MGIYYPTVNCVLEYWPPTSLFGGSYTCDRAGQHPFHRPSTPQREPTTLAMPAPDGLSSSPPTESASPKDVIAYYKAQYEALEAELLEFQASSRELEAELEKDIDASEKRERKLKEKIEGLKYESEEWKVRKLPVFG